MTLREKVTEAMPKVPKEKMYSSDIPALFMNHCQADFQVQYLSAEEFADDLDMTAGKRNYLKRYFA